jgi:uridylate kinase
MNDSAAPLYRRILLKMSGESLMGAQSFGLCKDTLDRMTRDIKNVVEAGVEVCMVVGGGNIFRGTLGENLGIERATADYMGMLATVMNALAVQSALEQIGVPTRVQSAITMAEISEPYIRRRALRHMEKGRVVIFAAGTGNPYFTTDTAATLRASEMGCDVLMKGTKVDGIYSADPKKNADAERFETITYHDVLTQNLKVMDATAIALARENNIPVIVFSIQHDNAIYDTVFGRSHFTRVHA